MKAYIILHNIIVEDERDENEVVDSDYEQIDGVDNPPIQVSQEQANGFMTFIQSHGCIRDREIHFNSNWTSLNIYDNCKASLET